MSALGLLEGLCITDLGSERLLHLTEFPSLKSRCEPSNSILKVCKLPEIWLDRNLIVVFTWEQRFQVDIIRCGKNRLSRITFLIYLQDCVCVRVCMCMRACACVRVCVCIFFPHFGLYSETVFITFVNKNHLVWEIPTESLLRRNTAEAGCCHHHVWQWAWRVQSDVQCFAFKPKGSTLVSSDLSTFFHMFVVSLIWLLENCNCEFLWFSFNN